MPLPDYKNESIVNLMSSIMTGFGHDKSPYKPLEALPPEQITSSTNTILLVIDGLGYECLLKYGPGDILDTYLRRRISTVFPSTTASAVTTFMTGAAPQEHAVTGWFMYLKELGTVATTLPYRPRFGGESFGRAGIPLNVMVDQKAISEKINARSYIVTQKNLVDSDYSRGMSGSATTVGYSDMDDMFSQIRSIIQSSDEKKYIYAYWPELDGLAHQNGLKHPSVKQHLYALDHAIGEFYDSILGTETTFIVTGDHGLIDRDENNILSMEKHPALAECLAAPLCGEPRVAYCYVHPGKEKQFEDYVSGKLAQYCELIPSGNLVEEGYFGLGTPHPKLHERIGHYTLMMKENYVISDLLPGEHRHAQVAVHGGLSDDEIYVPLIVMYA
jgi:hypothetical protein